LAYKHTFKAKYSAVFLSSSMKVKNYESGILRSNKLLNKLEEGIIKAPKFKGKDKGP